MKTISSFKMPFQSAPPLSQREGVNRPQTPPLDQFTNGLESLAKQNAVFNDPKVQERVKSILSFYPNNHTLETLENFYAGLQLEHKVVSMHKEQLKKIASFRQKLEKQFKTWTIN